MTYENLKEALIGHKEKGAKTLGIELQHVPDPDAMACGLFLYRIAEQMGYEPTITHGGPLAHPQNVVFVKRLGLESMMRQHDAIDPESFDAFAFVDHSGATSEWYREGKIPEDKLVALIDHHDLEKEPPKATFIDRRAVGAASSILAEYLQEMDIDDELRRQLATALVIGIRSDTSILSKNTTRFDDAMHGYLRDHADLDKVQQIERIDWPSNWMSLYGRAIRDRKRVNGVCVASVGWLDPRERDVIAMTADQLLSEQGVQTAYVVGLHKIIDVSVRTRDPTFNFEKLAESFPEGSSGGKEGAGGVQIENPFYESYVSSDKERGEQENMVVRETYRRVFGEG